MGPKTYLHLIIYWIEELLENKITLWLHNNDSYEITDTS